MKGPYILRVVAKSWGYGDCESEGIRVCTGVVSTGSEGKQTVWNNYYKGNRVRVWWKLRAGFWPHHGWGGCLMPMSAGTVLEPWSRMDAQVPWLVFGLGLLGLTELSVDIMRWHKDVKSCNELFGMGSGFIRVDWEVDWGSWINASSIAPEVTGN